VYERLARNVEVARGRLERPLTYAEKVFLGHFADPEREALEPGRSYVGLHPDRVAMQDATAQMALLQFMLADRDETAVPTTVHCDHLIQAYVGAARDTDTARSANREVYDFLRSTAARYGIGFWGPGAGIIHQVVLEQYAFPGGMMLGTDSHTPNAGGLGMFACGVGGADAVDVMAGFPWEVLYPKRVGIHLTGQLSGWAAPKDVILKVCEILTVKGGTNRVIEYLGPGARSISCTGKATIANMGAELGATTSIFPFDQRMATYLEATRREEFADLANRHAELLRADPEVEADPGRFFDELVEIDLSALEPHIVGPHTPDLARPVSRMARDARDNGYPVRLSSALIGSCTNSSYEDLERAADIARQARKHGARARAKLWVTPGSEQIHLTIQRDGQMEDFEAIGALVLANACGPCIGQWKRDDVGEGEENSIINSYNRNFKKRNDGNPGTYSFIASPEVVIAYALAGTLALDPLGDEIEATDGARFQLAPPAAAPEIPRDGFVHSRSGYEDPPEDRGGVDVAIDPASERLQRLDPFPAWDGRDIERVPLLLKAKGKCTTDHISPAHHRSHLARRQVAALPRAPREHQRQHVLRRDRRLHRRGRSRPRSALRGERCAFCEDRPTYQGGGFALGRRGRRELRRRLESGARGHVPPAAGRRRRHSAQLRAHPRDQSEEAGRAAPELREPGGLREGAAGRSREHPGTGRAGAGAAAAGRAQPRGRERGCLRGAPHAQRGAGPLVPGGFGAQSPARRRLTP
jgi:aconitate hydratase